MTLAQFVELYGDHPKREEQTMELRTPNLHLTPMALLRQWLDANPQWQAKVTIKPSGRVLATEKAMDAYVRWLDEQKGEALADNNTRSQALRAKV